MAPCLRLQINSVTLACQANSRYRNIFLTIKNRNTLPPPLPPHTNVMSSFFIQCQFQCRCLVEFYNVAESKVWPDVAWWGCKIFRFVKIIWSVNNRINHSMSELRSGLSSPDLEQKRQTQHKHSKCWQRIIQFSTSSALKHWSGVTSYHMLASAVS